MNYPASAYRQLSVQSATKLGLVVMLYDGAIATMQRAIGAIEAHDIEAKCTHLNRALAIIAQLEGTLNFELGGEVAQTLKSLYLYARAQVLKGNIENSSEILHALIDQFSTVREAWYEADQRPTPSRPEEAAQPDPRHQVQSAQQYSPKRTVGEDSPYASSSVPEPSSWRLSA